MWWGVRRVVCKLVRRLLLREGRMGSRSLYLRACRGCIGEWRAWGISVPTLFFLPSSSLLQATLPFPSPRRPTNCIIKHVPASSSTRISSISYAKLTLGYVHQRQRVPSALYIYVPSIHAYPLPFIPFSIAVFPDSFFLTRPRFFNTCITVPLRPLIIFKF